MSMLAMLVCGVHAYARPTGHLELKVLVLAYDPIMENRGGVRLHEACGWTAPETIVSNTVQRWFEASGGMIRFQIAAYTNLDVWPAKTDGFRYTDESYWSIYTNSWRGSHSPDRVDYSRVWSEDYPQMLSMVDSGHIDQVWCINGPSFGFWESHMVGKGAYWCNSSGEDAGNERCFMIMGPSMERPEGDLHNYGHAGESVLASWFYNYRLSYPGVSDTPYAGVNDYVRFTRNYYNSPGLIHCGNVHWAPNSGITGSTDEYNFSRTNHVSCYADTWLTYPDGPSDPRLMNNSDWGGGGDTAHMSWWFDHFPRSAEIHNGHICNWLTTFLNLWQASYPIGSDQTLVQTNCDLKGWFSYEIQAPPGTTQVLVQASTAQPVYFALRKNQIPLVERWIQDGSAYDDFSGTRITNYVQTLTGSPYGHSLTGRWYLSFGNCAIWSTNGAGQQVRVEIRPKPTNGVVSLQLHSPTNKALFADGFNDVVWSCAGLPQGVRSTEIAISTNSATGPWDVIVKDYDYQLASPYAWHVGSLTNDNVYLRLTVEDVYGNEYVTTSGRFGVNRPVRTNAVEDPVMAPLPGLYYSSVTVTMSCPTAGAEIWYRLDGQDPTNGSPALLYAAPVELDASASLKAVAYKTGKDPSFVVGGVYGIQQVTDWRGVGLPDTDTRDRHTALGSDGANLYWTLGDRMNVPFYRVAKGLTNASDWVSLAAMPLPLGMNSDAGVGDLGYFDNALWSLARINDSVTGRGVYRYSIADNAWSKGDPMGGGDGPNTACAPMAGNKIYGGWIGNNRVNAISDWTNAVYAQVGSMEGGSVHPWDACMSTSAVYFAKHYNVETAPGVLARIDRAQPSTLVNITGMPFNPGMGMAVEYLPGRLFADGHPRVYVLRGGTGTGNNDGRYWTTDCATNNLAVFDTVTESWSLETLPFAVDDGSEMALVDDTLYVLAANGQNPPLYAKTFVPVIVDRSAPTAPGGYTVAAIGTNDFLVQWSPSSDDIGVIGYSIYRNGAQVGDPLATQYLHEALSPNTEYSSWVCAYDAAGNTSAPSASLVITTQMETVKAPQFSPPGGTFHQVIHMAMTTETVGAQIRWTADLTDPTPQSTLYTQPVWFTNTCTIKARAFLDGMHPSFISTAIVEKVDSGIDENGVWLEAEDGILGGSWQVFSNANAVAGKCVSTLENTGAVYTTGGEPGAGSCQLSFTSTGATYAIWGRFITPSEDDNTLWVKINSMPYYQWTVPVSTEWGWNKWLNTYFAPGEHTLILCERVDGLQIDRLLLAGNLSCSPTGRGDGLPAWLVTATVSGAGWVSPGITEVLDGSDTNIVIQPAPWHIVTGLTVNGLSSECVTNLVLSNVVEHVQLSVWFDSLRTKTNQIPYWWIAQYGLTNGAVSFEQAPMEDADGDGMAAWEEYIAGTRPDDSQSVFTFDVQQNDQDDPVLSWIGRGSQRSYTVLYTTNLTQEMQPLGAPLLPGAEEEIPLSVTDSVQRLDDRIYYRMKVEFDE